MGASVFVRCVTRKALVLLPSLPWIRTRTGLLIATLLLLSLPTPAPAQQTEPAPSQTEPAPPQADQSQSETAADEPRRFTFKYREGDRYRIISTVDQTVRVNGEFSHNAELVNRIRVEVTDVRNGSGRMEIDYQHNAKSGSGAEVYEYGQVYEAEYWRDARGRYDVEGEYYVPVVRDVPVFPDRELEVGETWSRTGYEVHDLRRNYGIEEPFRFPIPVNYEYLGMRTVDGEKHPAISIQYNIFFRPNERYDVPRYPVMVSGYSSQTMYWSTEYDRPRSYEEEYLIVMTLSDGNQIQFEGTAEGEVVEATPLNRDRVTEEIQRDLDERNVEDATVSSDERGVTISLENIQFPPDSARLRESERAKLDQIAEILSNYPDRDILITGHTALAGTEEARQALSEKRAAAVGSYLIEQGVRNPNRLFYQGMGARNPVADNSTEEGMRRNRRVEFTILEN